MHDPHFRAIGQVGLVEELLELAQRLVARIPIRINSSRSACSAVVTLTFGARVAGA